MQQILELIQSNPELTAGIVAFALELVLRFIPGAKPLSKLLYDGLGKAIKDK